MSTAAEQGEIGRARLRFEFGQNVRRTARLPLVRQADGRIVENTINEGERLPHDYALVDDARGVAAIYDAPSGWYAFFKGDNVASYALMAYTREMLADDARWAEMHADSRDEAVREAAAAAAAEHGPLARALGGTPGRNATRTSLFAARKRAAVRQIPRRRPTGLAAALLNAAHRRVIDEGIAGPVTALVAVADPEDHLLEVANVGCSAALLLRGGEPVFRTEESWTSDNAKTMECLLPLVFNHGANLFAPITQFATDLRRGDVVVAASDGVFANLFDEHIARLVAEGVAAGASPADLAKRIVDVSFDVRLDASIEKPFHRMAMERRGSVYVGNGHPDDSTAIVLLVS